MSKPGLVYHFHVNGLFGELSIHNKLHVVVLELVLEGGHVVAVLGPVLGQGGHLPPAQLLQSCHIRVSGKCTKSVVKTYNNKNNLIFLN